jgi:glycosyltransferase involved in cell wall biosynthesis
MNIAIFSPSQNPYSETFIQAHKNNLKGNIFYYYGTRGNIKLENGILKNNLSYKLYCKLLKKPGYFIWKERLIRSLRSNNIDSILIEYGNHAYSLLPVLKDLKIPFVVHFHGYDASVNSVIKNCNNYNEIFCLANKIIAVSDSMKNKLVDYGCLEEKILVTPCAPNDLFFNLKPTFAKKQFISVGRFVNKKAPYLTILAFSKVVEKYPTYKLKMAGDGLLLNTCKNLVKYLGIQDNIQFLGVVTPEEYRRELLNSLAFVQHSITADNGDMEGTPVAVLEASVSGIPVISTKHAGIPDVIIHEQTGLLCEEKDVKKMAENMIKLIKNKELAVKLGVNGKCRIQNEFNMSIHISKIQEALNKND